MILLVSSCLLFACVAHAWRSQVQPRSKTPPASPSVPITATSGSGITTVFDHGSAAKSPPDSRASSEPSPGSPYRLSPDQWPSMLMPGNSPPEIKGLSSGFDPSPAFRPGGSFSLSPHSGSAAWTSQGEALCLPSFSGLFARIAPPPLMTGSGGANVPSGTPPKPEAPPPPEIAGTTLGHNPVKPPPFSLLFISEFITNSSPKLPPPLVGQNLSGYPVLNFKIGVVPEPSSFQLLMAGLLLVAFVKHSQSR